jgi:hypothetical protein
MSIALPALITAASVAQDGPLLEEIRQITKEAYIYGYPRADNSRIMYA